MHVRPDVLYGRPDVSASLAGCDICQAGFVQSRPDVQWQNIKAESYRKIKTCKHEIKYANTDFKLKGRHVYDSIFSGTWLCIPRADRITVHSESATEFTSGFPSDIPLF